MGILQTRILGWVVLPFSRGSFQFRDQTQVSRIAGRFFMDWATREAQIPLCWPKQKSFSVSWYRKPKWTFWSTHWLYSLQPNREKLCTVSKNKTGSWLWLRSWTPYCQIIARLKLKKVGKTIRLFRYDLNQIPYDYTVEVTYRFKGWDLIECLKSYKWRFMTLYKRQWPGPSPRKRNAKRQNGCLSRPYKELRKEKMWMAKEKRKAIPIWMQSSKD